MKITLDILQYLADLEQTHSISKTAQRFYLSQQTLSDKFKNLENDLQVSLLNRSPTGVTLTASCQELVQMSEPFLQDLKGWHQRAMNHSEDNSHLPTTLTIHLFSVCAGIVLPEVINIFQKNYPSIEVIIREKNYSEIFTATADGQCDIAFLSVNNEYFQQQMSLYPDLHDQILTTDVPIACISSKAKDLAAQPVLHITALSPQKKCAVLNIVDLGKYPRQGTNYYEGGNIDFIRRSIQQNDTIAIMPRRVYEELFSNSYFTYKPIAEATQTVYNAVLYAQDPLHPAFEYFIQLMAARL